MLAFARQMLPMLHRVNGKLPKQKALAHEYATVTHTKGKHIVRDQQYMHIIVSHVRMCHSNTTTKIIFSNKIVVLLFGSVFFFFSSFSIIFSLCIDVGSFALPHLIRCRCLLFHSFPPRSQYACTLSLVVWFVFTFFFFFLHLCYAIDVYRDGSHHSYNISFLWCDRCRCPKETACMYRVRTHTRRPDTFGSARKEGSFVFRF